LLLLVLVAILFLSSCTPEDIALIKTEIGIILPTLKYEASTIIPEVASLAKTEISFMKGTAEAASATEAAKSNPTTTNEEENNFISIFNAPYAVCVGKSTHLSSLPTGSDAILKKGYGKSDYTCDPDSGTLNTSILLFGGKEGNIFTDPSYESEIENGIEFDFTPSFTGNIRVEVEIVVNAKAGAAAGSATIIPEFRDVVLEFLLPTQIGAFIEVSEALIAETFASIKSDAYVYIDDADTRAESVATVGEHGLGASFPLPLTLHSQEATFRGEKILLTITHPLSSGISDKTTKGRYL